MFPRYGTRQSEARAEIAAAAAVIAMIAAIFSLTGRADGGPAVPAGATAISENWQGSGAPHRAHIWLASGLPAPHSRHLIMSPRSAVPWSGQCGAALSQPPGDPGNVVAQLPAAG
jgi:hypothetical protein